MQRCIALAKLGEGKVSPNPMVGAILVYNNIIIGEGYHQKFGAAHAEVNCINSVAAENEKFISSSTLYVSLEPCAHFGKTPPCVLLILQKKIPQVVIGCADSYNKVNGEGVKQLKDAGIYVQIGILEKECRKLNKHFFTFYEKNRPYIYLKYAQTKNKFIAADNNKTLKITNQLTNILVHKWRTQIDAILVGANTIRCDNPKLTARHWVGNNPIKFIIDFNLKLNTDYSVFTEAGTLVIFNKIKDSIYENIIYFRIKENEELTEAITRFCKANYINSLMVEGGAHTLQYFIDSNFWDEAQVLTNNELEIPKGLPSPHLKNELAISKQNIFNDTIGVYKNDKNEFLQ